MSSKEVVVRESSPRGRWGLVSGVVLGLALTNAAAAQEAPVVFSHVTVIDLTGSDAQARTDQTVVVSGSRLAAVGDSAAVEAPEGARIIDGTGKVLIPGLWDLHVHTRYAGIDHLRLLLLHGITTARDMGAPWDHLETIKQWQDEIARGERVGPRLLSAGPLLDGPGSTWSHSAVIDGPDAARDAVRRLRREGADFAKVYGRLSRESFFAIVDEAATQQLPVVGHVPTSITPGEASDAGQRTIEHLDDILLACSSDETILRAAWLARQRRPSTEQLLSTYDEEKARALFARLRDNGTRVVPTLSLYWTFWGVAAGNQEILAEDRMRYIPAAYRKQWAEGGPGGAVELARRRLDRFLAMVRAMHEQGVELLAGTDVVKSFFVPGVSLHDELALLVEAGLTASEALMAATRNPAVFFGLSDSGIIAEGTRADLVLLDANPLDDIRNTRSIAAVVAGGRLFEREELEAMRNDIVREASEWRGSPTGR